MSNLDVEPERETIKDWLGAVAKNADVILTALLLEARDCISVKDWDGRYLLINPAGAQFLGLSPQQIIGKTDFELFSQETALTIRKSDEQVMQTGKTQTFDAILLPLHGQKRHFQAMKFVYRNQLGDIQGIINVTKDVTAWKLAGFALP